MSEIKQLGIKPYDRVVVLTGAGISAESGIPTFRERGGIWQKYDAYKLATFDAFKDDPLLVWKFYSQRRNDILQAKPNEGHIALVALERYLKGKGSFLLVTQNVDGLHHKAGSENVLELHGNIFRTRCSNPECSEFRHPFKDENLYMERVPTCDKCGAALRPDVVWFGEMIDPDIEARVIDALNNATVFIAIGTSGVVYPAAGYVQIAALAGARTILVNKEIPHNAASFQEFYRGEAAKILPILLGSY